MREPLSSGLNLAVTLRHLASGDSYPTLQCAFRVARSTINKFVPEVCDTIIRAYRDEVMTCPTRRVVEKFNTFGILTSRFRIFQSPMQQEPPVVARVVIACLVLHNLLRMRYSRGQQDDFGAEGQAPIVLEGNDIPHEGQNPLEAAKSQRNILRDCFMTDGRVPGKWDRI